MTVIISSSKSFFNYCQNYDRYKNIPIYIAKGIRKYAYLLSSDVEIKESIGDIEPSEKIFFLDFIWLDEELEIFSSKRFNNTRFLLDLYDDLSKKLILVSSEFRPFTKLYHLKWSPRRLFGNLIEVKYFKGTYFLVVNLKKFNNVQCYEKVVGLSQFSQKIQNGLFEKLNLNNTQHLHIVLNNFRTNSSLENERLKEIKSLSSAVSNWYIKDHPNPRYNQYNDYLELPIMKSDFPSEFLLSERVTIYSLDSAGGSF